MEIRKAVPSDANEVARLQVTTWRSAYSGIISVWTLEKNPSVEFYRKMGGIQVGKKDTGIGDEIHAEIGFGWPR